jgi:hypothetical protein
MVKSKGLKRAKELFLYSDSEPNEVLIGMCHLICLPMALVTEFANPSYLLIVIAMGAGLYQLWSALWSGSLIHRLRAVQIASLVAIATCENLWAEGLLVGSRTGWCIICAFALWNTIRVTKEKLARRV